MRKVLAQQQGQGKEQKMQPIVVIYKESAESATTLRRVVYADCFYTAMNEVLRVNPNAFIVGEA